MGEIEKFVPSVSCEGAMPSLSCKGRALSLGMSSGTMARGCPSATAAARHTCFIRGPPTGCPYMTKMTHNASVLIQNKIRDAGVAVIDMIWRA